MRRTLLAAAIAALTTLFSAAPASAARGMEIALQDDSVFLNRNYHDREVGFQQARSLGVTWMRVNVLWERVLGQQATLKQAPAAPQYDFAALDSMVDAAAAHGIQVQMTLTGKAPAFATADRKVGPYKPNPAMYGAFVRAVAQHFKGRVHRYAIWNEPNWKGWLAPQWERCRRGRCKLTAARIYRSLYQAGYKAVKSVDPTAQVMFGELAPQARKGKSVAPLTFLREATRGRGLRTDGFAHHPYAFAQKPTARPKGPNDVTMGNLGKLTKELTLLNRKRRLRGPRGKPPYLYLTEYGYFARGPRALPARVRGRYLAQGFKIGLKNPRVKQVLQYQLVSPPASDPWDTSLIAGSVPQPQFLSLQAFAQAQIARGAVAVP